MVTAIWWVRRDLRLRDNQALAAALAAADLVIPIFVLDPALLAAPDVSTRRLAFLFSGLRGLDAALRDRGSRLVVRKGDPRDELVRLLRESRSVAVYAEEDPWPYARIRDRGVGEAVSLRLSDGLMVHPPAELLKAGGQPYIVFTPFSRAWKQRPSPTPQELIPAPSRIYTPAGIAGIEIPATPEPPLHDLFPAGEAEAMRRLRAFTVGRAAPIFRYADDRNRIDLGGTSQLSPYLRFGMVSARQCVTAALTAMRAAEDDVGRHGAETWLNELIWREFYMTILYHFPGVLDEAFQPDRRNIQWSDDPDAFAAWCTGRTGFPVVDAGMRHLAQTGWMHNRARMIVASFLVKDLLVDWRRGEMFFMQHLVDGDPAANNGGWQWTAGVGTDAAPYFRVFNPTLQGAKFDPNGDYVRQWVPELRYVPTEYIHEPSRMAADLQQRVGCVIGIDYPAPILDHGWARQRVLEAYRRR